MKRAEFPGDRWSGHVSFPGGSEESVDRDMFSTAVRETREEVGLDLLTQARPLGRLNTTNTRARSPIRPLMIVPFVFELQQPVTLRLSAEAVESFWLPLDPAFSGSFDETYHHPFGPVRMKFPSWHYQGKVVWGLTYNMLQDLRGRKT